MKKRLFVIVTALAITSISRADTPAPQGKLYTTSWFGGVINIVDVAGFVCPHRLTSLFIRQWFHANAILSRE